MDSAPLWNIICKIRPLSISYFGHDVLTQQQENNEGIPAEVAIWPQISAKVKSICDVKYLMRSSMWGAACLFTQDSGGERHPVAFFIWFPFLGDYILLPLDNQCLWNDCYFSMQTPMQMQAWKSVFGRSALLYSGIFPQKSIQLYCER